MRAHLEAARLDSLPAFRGLSGNIVFPGFAAPKLEWVRFYEPEVFDRVAKVLLPATYLGHYMTGDFVADMSDSAGTSWLDVRELAWSEPLLTVGHMRRDQMPRPVEGCAPAGHLRDDLARAWGLRGSVTLAGGAGDNAAAACGIGALRERQSFISLGTSGVLLAARATCQPAPDTAVHTFCHAIPGHWYQMGVMVSATECLNWLSNMTGQAVPAMIGDLGAGLQVPGAVRFLPYLAGKRTPHNDAAIRGSFTGLAQAGTREDLTRAVLEGVAFGLRDSFEALRATGAKLDRITAIGGGARSRYWLEVIATTLGVPLELPEDGKFGAAGHLRATEQAPQDVMQPPEPQDVIEPDATLRDAYDDAYAGFRKAYPAIRAIQ